MRERDRELVFRFAHLREMVSMATGPRGLVLEQVRVWLWLAAWLGDGGSLIWVQNGARFGFE